MNRTLDLTEKSRKIIAPFLENYSLEQLNVIPKGFSNNLIWNIAHVVVTQQLLVYKLSGLPMLVSDELVEKYKKGSKVDFVVDQQEVEVIKSLLFSTLEQTKVDFENNIFQKYSEYPTSTGYVLSCVEDALTFNNFHEALHIGIMMSIRKFV